MFHHSLIPTDGGAPLLAAARPSLCSVRVLWRD